MLQVEVVCVVLKVWDSPPGKWATWQSRTWSSAWTRPGSFRWSPKLRSRPRSSNSSSTRNVTRPPRTAARPRWVHLARLLQCTPFKRVASDGDAWLFRPSSLWRMANWCNSRRGMERPPHWNERSKVETWALWVIWLIWATVLPKFRFIKKYKYIYIYNLIRCLSNVCNLSWWCQISNVGSLSPQKCVMDDVVAVRTYAKKAWLTRLDWPFTICQMLWAIANKVWTVTH